MHPFMHPYPVSSPASSSPDTLHLHSVSLAISPRGGDSDGGPCSPGTFFYACDSNNFHGCCSIDPCDQPSCPDDMAVGGSAPIKDPPPGDDQDGQDDVKSTKASRPSNESTLPQSTETHLSRTDANSKALTQSLRSQTNPSKTDSGITHTVPNSSIVTVTRHTVIVTNKQPPPSQSPTSSTVSHSLPASSPTISTSNGTASIPPTATGITPDAGSSDQDGSPMSSGAIVGIAVGGAAVLAILVVLAYTYARWKRSRSPSPSGSPSTRGLEREDTRAEKHFAALSMSANTTGTQSSGSDPFAPFGGRADQQAEAYQSLSGIVEMEGSSAAPVELSSESITPSGITGTNTRTNPSPYAPRLDSVRETEHAPADPRANLNSVCTDGGEPAYINHWNQYRALGQG